MIPADPTQLDTLAAAVAGHLPLGADGIADVVRYRQTHQIPALAARLHAAETALAHLRHAIAMHAARADAGEDVTPADLLDHADRHGVPLAEDVTEAAQALAALYAVETRW